MKQPFQLLTTAVAAFTLPLAALPAAADAGEGYGGYHHMMGGGWFMGPFMMLIVIIVLVAAAIFAFRLFGNPASPDGAPASDRALTILRERFAKGEIDQAEFEERRKALE
tara:strand:+ start:291 stop:620 length:330 start_codon:yes stop_codon:yes gene_type:complete